MSSCSTKSAQKGCKFYAAANVLVLSLPQATFTGRKIKHHISFPHSIDLAKWTHESSPELLEGFSLQYDLVSIMQHHGKSASGGHYTVTCRLGSEGRLCVDFVCDSCMCCCFNVLADIAMLQQTGSLA